jgi:hypothetical protein
MSSGQEKYPFICKGGSKTPPPPFLVTLSVNVGQDPFETLKQIGEFKKYLEKKRKTHVVMTSVKNPAHVFIFSAMNNSRYFAAGRKRMQRNIKNRLGSRWFSTGVMLTLTYDPSKTTKYEAWSNYNTHWRTLIDSLNKIRRRNRSRPLRYVWTVEEQKGTGYPHIHVFFPLLHYLIDVKRLSILWSYGRHECKYKDNINVASYVCKYLSKFEGMSFFSQALIWYKGKRLYGYTRSYCLPQNPTKTPPLMFYFTSITDLRRLEYLYSTNHYFTFSGVDPPLGFKGFIVSWTGEIYCGS